MCHLLICFNNFGNETQCQEEHIFSFLQAFNFFQKLSGLKIKNKLKKTVIRNHILDTTPELYPGYGFVYPSFKILFSPDDYY